MSDEQTLCHEGFRVEGAIMKRVGAQILPSFPQNRTEEPSRTARSSQLQLGRVALSAFGWYQKGPCVNYDYMIIKITLKFCTKQRKVIFKACHSGIY